MGVRGVRDNEGHDAMERIGCGGERECREGEWDMKIN